MIIIKFKPEAANRLAKDQFAKSLYNALLSRFGVNKVEKIFPTHTVPGKESAVIDLSCFYYLNYSENADPYEVAKAFSSNPLIEYAEPKYIRHLTYTPNDPFYFRQNALKKIQADKAWDINKGDSNVVIGIVDTGIDWLHPDLAMNIWINKKEIPDNGIDDDNNGYIDDVRGWDFGGNGNGNLPTPDNNPNEDNADHGTHVAGIASAVTNNNIGISGIGFKCKLMAVKVTQNNQRDATGPFVLYGYEGIVYAADNGANIINCSWGGGGFSRYENDIIEYVTQKGALVVAAAGNDGEYSNSFYPAAYNHVLAVGSTEESDTKSSFSNYGPYVDVSAPGGNIYSTWFNNSYSFLSGTSMASPHAAGVAALVKSAFPDLTPDQIGERIRISCDKIDSLNPFYAYQLGFGRINAYRALTINSPAVRMTSFSINDTLVGNADGILEPGEKAQIRVQFKNFLSSTSNLSINLTSQNSYVTITKGSLTFSSINTLESFNNNSQLFEIQVSNSVPYNFEGVLMLSFQDDNYNDFQEFVVNLNPSYANSNINNIDVTVTSAGNIGFNDYSDNLQGTGFRYKNEENILFEGALMFGRSSTQLSDAARGTSQATKDDHFQTIKPISFGKGIKSDWEGLTIFNDDLNPNKMNIKTTLKTYSWRTAPDNNYILLCYELLNTSSSAIDNFYAGLFFDWDIGPNGDKNITKYDSLNQLAYAYNNTHAPKTYAGASLLNYTNKISYWPILNDDIVDWQIYDGFTPAEKFQALSSGVQNKTKGPGDISMVIGAGPFSIPSGEKVTIWFALLAADTLPDLQNSCQLARVKYNQILGTENSIKNIPLDYELCQNYPNPFNPSTTIKFNLKQGGNIKLQIFDIKGSIVKEIVKNDLQAGEQVVNINLSNFASGMYLYKITVFNKRDDLVYINMKKMVLMR
jgi:hypothetical protein